MKTYLTLTALFISLFTFAQTADELILEDKNDMADEKYGTFKFKGEPYTGTAMGYHDNGKNRSMFSFENGRYHGWSIEWYRNGNLKFQGKRKMNKLQGLVKWWYANGNLKKQGTYKMDEPDGVIIQWHENGQLKKIAHYKEGKQVIPGVDFNEAGNPTNN